MTKTVDLLDLLDLHTWHVKLGPSQLDRVQLGHSLCESMHGWMLMHEMHACFVKCPPFLINNNRSLDAAVTLDDIVAGEVAQEQYMDTACVTQRAGLPKSRRTNHSEATVTEVQPSMCETHFDVIFPIPKGKRQRSR